MRILALALVGLLVLPVVAADHTGDIIRDPAYDAGLVPGQDEIKAIIDSLEGNPWATVHQVGASLDGTPLMAAAFTDPDSNVPMEARVVVFIMTQQHGNEPAGTPAAMQLMEVLRDGGPAREHLSNQVVIVLAQSNPDGALDNRRENEDGEDINRDHVDVGTPEAKAIHEVLKRWDVHMAFDHHEYGGLPVYGIGYPSPVGSYDYDITTMFPNHGNVRAPTSDMSLEVNEAVKTGLAAKGYSHGDYGITTLRVGPESVDLAQTAGGPDPGILRNSYGLNNIAGLLIESFIPPAEASNPLQSFERRVASHAVVMDEVMSFAHDNAAAIIAAKRESERLNLEDPPARYLEGEITSALAGVYFHDAHDAFEAHGLPAPATPPAGGRFLTVLAQERAGLIAALLHPDSTRAVANGVGGAQSDLDRIGASYYAHPDFGAASVAEPLDAVDDAQVPALPVLAALAMLVTVAIVRRR